MLIQNFISLDLNVVIFPKKGALVSLSPDIDTMLRKWLRRGGDD